jgi:hypothetical protein
MMALPPGLETFAEAIERGVLLYQACMTCGAVQVYPRARCTKCHGDCLAWRESGRHGTVEAFTIVHRAADRRFRDRVPYVIAIIQLAEGCRLMVNMSEPETAGLEIGMAVEIGFASVDGAIIPEAFAALPGASMDGGSAGR